MSNTINDKVVLITGSAVRVGADIARYFAANGWQVIVHCNSSRAAGEKLVQELLAISPGHHLIVQDLLEKDAAEKLLTEAAKLAGSVSLLINNASLYSRSSLLETSIEDLLKAYQINFFVAFELMRQFALRYKKGCIINMLDQRIATVDPAAGAYAFAKKSLKDATKACALEWAPEIRVNAVAPGIVMPPPGIKKPDGIEKLKKNIPLQKIVKTQELAEACLFLANAENISGQIIYVDGAMNLTGQRTKEPNIKISYQ